MINAIVNGFYSDALLQVLDNVSRKTRIDYLYLVYHTKTIENLPIQDVQRVQYHSLLRLDPSLCDVNDLIPLDEELITNLANCERMVLKMIDRLEVGRRYTYQERIEMYYFYLRYWNTVIENHRVNVFVSANVPHEIFDYVIYGLCRAKKIPIIFLYHQSQIEDVALLMHDWKENSLKLQERFQELQKHFEEKDEAQIHLSEKLQTHFDAQVIDSSDAVPFYMKTRSNRWARWNFSRMITESVTDPFLKNPVIFFLKCINPISWFFVIYHLLRLTLLQLKIVESITNAYFRLYYWRHSVHPDTKKLYLYIPLQYQPELSTSPLADVFVDQQLIIQMISKYVPKNVFLYVKEHPKQTAFCRSIKFYQDLLQTRNVVFVRKDSSSFELIKHSVAVATSTGTPGWEALFREKPVLMFGSYIYQFADGVFKITTNADCRRALDQILNHNVRPSLKNMKLYLKALGEVSIPAVIDPDYLRVSKLTEKENISNITVALLEEINHVTSATGSA